MENEQRIAAQEVAREMTHQRQQMSAQLFGLTQENEALQKQVRGLEERLAEEQADKQAQVSSAARFPLCVAWFASRLVLVLQPKPALNDAQLDVRTVPNMCWQRCNSRLMYNNIGLWRLDQYIHTKNVVCRSAQPSSVSLTWALGMLQVFVAGFVSKMMERVIAEQKVAAEHQRQIRELQYVSQTVIPPKHALEVLVLLVGMVDSPQGL